jgi:hypothetical protein
MIPLKMHRDNRGRHRADPRPGPSPHLHFRPFRRHRLEAPWTVKTDGGFGFHMDPRQTVNAIDKTGQRSDAMSGYHGRVRYARGLEHPGLAATGWSHPVHVHFEEGIILSRGGKAPPEWEKWARKDVYRIGSEMMADNVEMAINFREFAGTYMEHCHNTQHEDNSMLLRWDIENPGQFQLMPTPLPTLGRRALRQLRRTANLSRNGDGCRT